MAQELVPGVTADPSVAFGKPVFAGTRVHVALVLGQPAAGIREQEICAEYDLQPEQIQAALHFAARRDATREPPRPRQ